VTGKEAMKLETLNEALEQFTLATVGQDKPLLGGKVTNVSPSAK